MLRGWWNPLFPPRPAITPFPQSYGLPAKPNAVTLTYLHLALHPALYQHDEQLYKTSFPRFEGIWPTAFGYYPEMFFDDNAKTLTRAMPNVNKERDYPQITVTWSHSEHPQLAPHDPNETLYPTPGTFYLTFYPPIHCVPHSIPNSALLPSQRHWVQRPTIKQYPNIASCNLPPGKRTSNPLCSYFNISYYHTATDFSPLGHNLRWEKVLALLKV